MNRLEKCPVCDGKGKVIQGFYDLYYSDRGRMTTGGMPSEICRSCNGKGYVVFE